MPKKQAAEPSAAVAKPATPVQDTVKSLVAQGKVDAAQAFLQDAVKADPSNPNLNLQMADFYLDVVKDSSKALPYLEQSLANSERTGFGMDPALESLVDLASGSQVSSVRERAAKAVQDNAARDDSADAQLALGRVQSANGDTQGAMKSLDTAASKGSAAAHHEKAGILLGQGDPVAAAREANQAYQKSLADQDRARANGESGEQFKAETDKYLMDTGTMQIWAGQTEEGLAKLRQYTKDHPEDRAAQEALRDGESRAIGEKGMPNQRKR